MNHTLLPVEEFVARRQRFVDQLPNASVALFAANGEVTRSNDTEYPFCQNKNFYYLTGFNEPEALLVMVKDANGNSVTTLFCREKNPLQEVWHGRRTGPVQAQQQYAFDAAYINSEADQRLPELFESAERVYFCFADQPAFEQQVFSWLTRVKASAKQGKKAPAQLLDCSDHIAEMRLVKSPAELDIMRKANVLSGLAHQRAMKQSAVGKFEYQIEAEMLHEFALHGARYPAYGSIVAGADNANILHYTDNQDALIDNSLLLIDAGGELAGYAADITRTFPVNGKFTDAQAKIYQLVLDSQLAVIEAIKPGANFAQLTDIAIRVLTEGLVELGILTGDIGQLVEDKACKDYFIHGLGHWLGLDVHDVGDYHIDENRRQLRAFEPGMVMTIEPGLYFPADCLEVAPKWRGIGVRIEDNIVVTEQGYENITVNSPKTIAEIEALMAS